MINLEKLTETAVYPSYGTSKSACFDISADIQNRTISMRNEKNQPFEYEIKNKLTIPPHWRALIPTGFIWHLKEGYELNFLSRSGQSWKNGVIVLNAPAVIDEDYVQESFVVLHNTTDDHFVVEQGQRIAQGKVSPVIRVDFESGGDRSGGFGSTGS